jgi:inosine/xanthosine triphosphatase
MQHAACQRASQLLLLLGHHSHAPVHQRLSAVVMNSEISVAVGSLNPVKCAAAERGLKSTLKLDSLRVEGCDANSDVPDQPIGDAEIKLGATNRARNAFDIFRVRNGFSPSYSVGIEGGILISNEGKSDDEMDCMAWVVVFDGCRFGSARTASFSLPRIIQSHIRNGIELGAADDLVFGRTNSKCEDGIVGHFTRGVLDRTEYYVPAVILAMIPLEWPTLWPTEHVSC